MSVTRFRRKPQPDKHDIVHAARYEPGKPGSFATLDDLFAVARMADPDAQLTEVTYTSKAFPRLSGRYLLVVYSRLPEEHPAEMDTEVVAPGEWLVFSPGYYFLHSSDDHEWTRFYDKVPE